MNRKKHDYIVQLQRSDGEISEEPYSVYWDPEREGAADDVAHACAAQTSVFAGGRRDREGNREFVYAGLTAVLQEPIAA